MLTPGENVTVFQPDTEVTWLELPSSVVPPELYTAMTNEKPVVVV